MGIFITLAVLGLILTNSEAFVKMVQQTGQTVSSLFSAMTFQKG